MVYSRWWEWLDILIVRFVVGSRQEERADAHSAASLCPIEIWVVREDLDDFLVPLEIES